MMRLRMFEVLPTVSLALLFAFLGALVSPLPVAAASTQDIVVGVNMTNADRLKLAQQIDMLKAMKAAGVRVIRAGIANNDAGIAFAKAAQVEGIKIDWIVGFFDAYAPGAPTRAYQPQAFPGMWAGHPLSYVDPELFRPRFAALLARLDDAGIRLEAIEVGNELNMTGFNPEFPLPGESRQFGLDDLAHDPEAEQIAKGYLQYLKILAVVKDVRDHASVNRATPVLTAGFGAYETPEGPINTHGIGLVSINATIDFLRAHGLDRYVDAYAIHVYPWGDHPGTPAGAAGRQSRLAKFVLNRCRPEGSKDGKPCWITEWGFNLHDANCPINDTDRTALVREMMGNFKPYVQSGRLKGLLYYAWNTDPWAKAPSPGSLYLCGGLTGSGRLALDPALLH